MVSEGIFSAMKTLVHNAQPHPAGDRCYLASDIQEENTKNMIYKIICIVNYSYSVSITCFLYLL